MRHDSKKKVEQIIKIAVIFFFLLWVKGQKGNGCFFSFSFFLSHWNSIQNKVFLHIKQLCYNRKKNKRTGREGENVWVQGVLFKRLVLCAVRPVTIIIFTLVTYRTISGLNRNTFRVIMQKNALLLCICTLSLNQWHKMVLKWLTFIIYRNYFWDNRSSIWWKIHIMTGLFAFYILKCCECDRTHTEQIRTVLVAYPFPFSEEL